MAQLLSGTRIFGTANVDIGVSVGNNIVVANTTQFTTTVPFSANGSVGTAGQVLVSNGSIGSSYWSSSVKNSTAIATTSGTAAAFTNIPSWVKRITLMFNGVSTNGTNTVIVQLGTGATPTYTTSGYNGTAAIQTGAIAANFSSGFIVSLNVSAADVFHGQMVVNNLNSNIWVESSMVGLSSSATSRYGAGSVSLGAALTAIQLTAANGTDAFDAGSINILYE